MKNRNVLEICPENRNCLVKLPEEIEILGKFTWKNRNFSYPDPRPPRFQTRLTPLTCAIESLDLAGDTKSVCLFGNTAADNRLRKHVLGFYSLYPGIFSDVIGSPKYRTLAEPEHVLRKIHDCTFLPKDFLPDFFDPNSPPNYYYFFFFFILHKYVFYFYS